MRDFRKLTVWRRSHALTLEVYRQTTRFPDHERYGLTPQLANHLGYLRSTRDSALSREIIEVKKMLVAFETRLTADS